MTEQSRIQELEQKVEQLTNQVGVLEDVHAIRRLQHAYGYYIDKCLYDETVDLFAENGEVHFMGGIFAVKQACGGFTWTASATILPAGKMARFSDFCSTIRKCKT